MVNTAVVKRLAELAATQHGVLTRKQALGRGLTRSQWQRGASGLLTPLLPGTAAVQSDGLVYDPAFQRARAGLLIAGHVLARACVGSGLRLYGVQGTPQHDPEHVLLPDLRWHQRPGLARHWFRIDAGDKADVEGIPALTLQRCLLDAARTYDAEHLLSVADSALHQRKLTKAELAVLIPKVPISQRAILSFADSLRESPLESRIAIMLVRGGFTNFVMQHPVALPSGEVRLDFLIDDMVVVEGDGRSYHDDISTRYADRERHEALERLGYLVVRVTWADVVLHPAKTLQRIRDAVADAARRRQLGLGVAM